ncbi:acetamidase regulatory protein [Grosmannia clavigera kw1407]|uniref:Acetamidase regulatory protein n=1 Tax=Grosmannia clavigera (strain kw1407 / UAMH 11150) TaxID=655863 RepID=F0XSW1_GROCL|nr:acetamidase regulatory protein [Grosmannia clavigera kw1407]EFW99187.1 acetamidase regulatory protein [Grosmannia clavigera kw1407]
MRPVLQDGDQGPPDTSRDRVNLQSAPQDIKDFGRNARFRLSGQRPTVMDQHRRRQQRKACDVCRRRKVRCDIELQPGGRCSVCSKADIECRSTTQWAKPRRRTTGAADAGAGADVPIAVAPPKTGNDAPLQDMGSRHAVEASPESGPRAQGSVSGAASTADGDGGSSRWAARTLSTGSSTATKPQQQANGDGEAGSDKRSSGCRQEQLARSGLARFFKQGIGAGIWKVFDPTDFRIAYVGTAASNMAHLVDLHASHRQQPLSPAGTATAADPGGLGRALHYPYPPIRPPKSWKPSVQDWGFSLPQDLASDVSSFPVPEVRDALVAAYFRHIHPILPVVSMPEFLAAYSDASRSPPPLLLFQAVLMAGAHACDHPLVAADRHAVKSVLFRRAALLYHTRHETDRIHLMQAALLFTWHVGDGDTISGGPWYWAGIAVRIGCGMGAHRHNAALPTPEAAQYCRCWWTAFVCEVLSALETGRPCAVRAEDMDQMLPTDAVLTDAPAAGADVRGGASAAFLSRIVELCYIGLDILSANAPSRRLIVDMDGIDNRLGLWSLRAGIASTLSRGDGSAAAAAVATTDAVSYTAAEQCQLRMHYGLMLLHLHRSCRSQTPATPASPSVCSAAARAVITSLETLATLDGGLAGCHFASVSAVTAAAIQTAHEVHEAALARSFLIVITALEQLARLLRVAELLAKHWPNAQAICDVFQELHQEYETYVAQDLRGEQAIIPESQPDWNLLLAGVQMSRLSGGLASEQDWMNMPNMP